jgi:hypothetical protein
MASSLACQNLGESIALWLQSRARRMGSRRCNRGRSGQSRLQLIKVFIKIVISFFSFFFLIIVLL